MPTSPDPCVPSLAAVLLSAIVLLHLAATPARADPGPQAPSSADVLRAAERVPRSGSDDSIARWTTPDWSAARLASAGPRLDPRTVEQATGSGGPQEKTGWGLDLRGAWLHQFDADVDDGGRMGVDRFLMRASLSYRPKPKIPLTLSLGYRYDAYRFGGTGLFGAAPWGDVHSLRASIPFAYPISKKWLVFFLPTVRTTVEDGAPLEDGITWGFIAAASYRVNDRLTIGPGVGIFGELEDNASVIPILFIDWKITPTLSVKTGQGLGATQGPGLFLEWTPNNACWTLSLGGRYERNRFRLNDHGFAPGGIGEETAFALLLSAQYRLSPKASLNASVGTAFLGNLRLEDAQGDFLLGEGYDPAVFVGIGFDIRF